MWIYICLKCIHVCIRTLTSAHTLILCTYIHLHIHKCICMQTQDMHTCACMSIHAPTQTLMETLYLTYVYCLAFCIQKAQCRICCFEGGTGIYEAGESKPSRKAAVSFLKFWIQDAYIA